MRKIKILLSLGILVSILPYLGFPTSAKNIITTLAGFGIIYFSYVLHTINKKPGSEKKSFENFSENNNFKEVLDGNTNNANIV